MLRDIGDKLVSGPNHPRQPGHRGVDAEEPGAGDEVLRHPEGQPGHPLPQRAQPQRAGERDHPGPGPDQMQRDKPAKGIIQREQKRKPVGRIEDRGLVIGNERRTVAEVGIPQRQMPGADRLQRELPPRVKLEERRAPIQHLPAEEEWGEEDERREDDEEVGPPHPPTPSPVRTARRDRGSQLLRNLVHHGVTS